eukprot:Selendium_serpulae@DN6498_c0_g1_i11.p4
MMKLKEFLIAVAEAERPEVLLDYSPWVPGPTYYPLPEQTYIDVYEESEGGSGGARRDSPEEEEVVKEEPPPVPEQVDEGEVAKAFKAQSGGKDTIPPAKAAEIAREQGLAPSQDDVENLQKSTGGSVTMEQLNDFFSKSAHPEDTPDFLCQFFGYYDPDQTGVLSKKVIAHLLGNFGDALEKDCITQVLKDEPDPVNYRAFAERMMKREK